MTLTLACCRCQTTVTALTIKQGDLLCFPCIEEMRVKREETLNELARALNPPPRSNPPFSIGRWWHEKMHPPHRDSGDREP